MSRHPPPIEDHPHTVEDDRGCAGGRDVTITRSFLFVILESERLLAGGARYALDGIDEVVIGRGTSRAATRERVGGVHRLSLRLPGPALSGLHARLRRTPPTDAAQSGQADWQWVLEDAGSTNGCYVNGQRLHRKVLAADDMIELGRSFLAVRRYQLPGTNAVADLDSSARGGVLPPGLTTLDPALAETFEDLRQIAASPISVLVRGETGVGKELIARGVHELSRRSGPFVAVNCGALTRSLVESQLFGHVKGAFSGATSDSPGFIRAADGGTLLLDEVPDLDPAMQVSLLRVLQEREVVPVGASRPIPVDLRVVAATPASIPDLVSAGRFRADLFARLAGFTVVAPPLRDRRVDIGLVVAALLTKMGVTGAENMRMTPTIALAILRHPWPLNIRSLEQLLLRSRVLSKNGMIDAASAHFPDSLVLSRKTGPIGTGKDHGSPDDDGGDQDHHSPDDVETRGGAGAASPGGTEAALSSADLALKIELQQELTDACGNVAAVARQRGIARMQVYRWLHRFGIDARSFRRDLGDADRRGQAG